LLAGIIAVGIVSALAIVGLYWYELGTGADIRYARTTALNTAVFLQFFHVWNSRSFTRSVFSIPFFSNPFLFMSLTIATVAQIAVLSVPVLQYIFDTTRLTFVTWMQTVIAAASVIVVVELGKLYFRKRPH
jgi:Ca2+-transporting ATPase